MPILRGTMNVASRSVLSLLVNVRFIHGGLSMPSITTSSWFSAIPPPIPPMPPGNMKLKTLAIRSWKPETPSGCGALESKSLSRQARVSTIRSPEGSRDPIGPKKRRSSASAETSGSNSRLPPVPSDCLRMPTASISSMKTMHWPPHLRASRLALRASTRTTIASIPMKVAAKPEPGIEMNGELKPVAIAFASIVLPVPGAPKRSRPRSRFPPARSKWSPDCQISTTRRTSSLASAWPRTSSSLTPHSASPGSNDCICDRFIISSGPNMIAKFAKKRKKTKTAWIHSCGEVRRLPICSHIVPAAPHQVPPTKIQRDRDRDRRRGARS